MYRLGDNAQKSYVVHRRLTNNNGFRNVSARNPIKLYNFASKLNIFKNYG